MIHTHTHTQRSKCEHVCAVLLKEPQVARLPLCSQPSALPPACSPAARDGKAASAHLAASHWPIKWQHPVTPFRKFPRFNMMRI